MEYDFRAEKKTSTTTRILTPTGEIVYLVEGSNKAMLIDSGLGLGKLKEFVHTLTTKPLKLLITHGHLDHVGGAFAFGKAYINPDEIPLAKSHNDLQKKKQYAAMLLGGNAPDDRDFEPCELPVFSQLSDGDTFDLGGVTLVTYKLPGHTAGIMTVLNKEERWLLLGDACNVMTLFIDPTSLPIEKYETALTDYKEKYGEKFDRVFLSHGVCEVPKAVIDGVIQVCDDVINGNTDDVPFPFIDGVYSLAKAVDFPAMVRKDGGIGNIVYDKARLA